MPYEELKIVKRENGNVEFRKVIKNEEVTWSMPRDEYQLLSQISEKYSLPLPMILEMLLLEARAVKKGLKTTPLKDLSSIVTKYIKNVSGGD